MSKFEKAWEREKEGDYREAAALYAQSGFDGLVDCNFEPRREMRIRLAILLLSISCDVRADNYHRPGYIFDIAESLFQDVAENAESRVLVGLTKEWMGDGLLMLGSPTAKNLYQEAREYYDGLDWGERSWGHEQEFHYAFIAVQSFLTASGIETPEEPHLPIHFVERIEFKVKATERLLE